MRLHPYRCESAYPEIDAQRNLDGRTHYVDPETLRYFRSKILHAEHVARGMLYVVVESRGIDAKDGRRGMRVVVFNLAGNVVHHSRAAHWFRSTRAARRAIPGILEEIDARGVNLASLEELERWSVDEIERARRAIDERTPAPAPAST
jgi:hypothetical protein